jgi:hypothetical protein
MSSASARTDLQHQLSSVVKDFGFDVALSSPPSGYSWAGCSPAEPACASPAEGDDGNKEEN